MRKLIILELCSLLILLVALERALCANTCDIAIASLLKNEPVFLTKNNNGYRLKRPYNGKLTFKKGEKYEIVCTNDGELQACLHTAPI
jgi:hypothetical protein